MLLHGFWIVPLALLIAYLSSPRARGDIAESRVRRLLASGLEKSRYTIVNNLEIPSGGGTVHVDHLVVSKFGVFVIESVYARGWISGGEFQERWKRQHLGRTERLENPLHRNTLQADAVAKLTGLPNSRLHPLVVMVGAQGFKSVMPDRLLLPEKLIRHMRRKGQMLLDDEQAARVLAKIKDPALAGNGAGRRDRRRRWLLVALWAILLAGLYLAYRDPLEGWWQAQGKTLLRREDATEQRPDGNSATDRERWEETLICAYSSDTGRCSCYDPNGVRADLSPQRCRDLAERGSILRQ